MRSIRLLLAAAASLAALALAAPAAVAADPVSEAAAHLGTASLYVDPSVAGVVKVNQNGTLSGTLRVIALARSHGYAPIVSARSGETEDPFIADLAVGSAAGQIKIGSLRTSSTVAKYNQLLRIEEECRAPYAGLAALAPDPA